MQIEIEGACAVASALADGACPRLLSLNMRQVPDHVELLHVSTYDCRTVTDLLCVQNLIQNEGVTEVCKALEEHSEVTALDLRENAFKADGGSDTYINYY